MDIQTDTYISRAISIEHPSVGLASLAQLVKIIARTGVQLIPKIVRARTCCYKLIVCLRTEQKFLTNECLLEKWFPLQGELAQSFKKFYVRTLVKNKIERRKRRQNKNRPINLPQGNNIVHILHVHHLTLNFIIHNKYISTIYLINIYIHTYYESL